MQLDFDMNHLFQVRTLFRVSLSPLAILGTGSDPESERPHELCLLMLVLVADKGVRIATEYQGEKGNYALWFGVSMFYLDQTSTGIVKLGDFILGDRFGEVKN